MTISVHDIARMTDLSAVRTDVDLAEVRQLAETCRKYHCICAFAMPCYTRELKAMLADAPDVRTGGVVGFPSGSHATPIKVAEARQALADGADELDMVINVGWLRSGCYDRVEEDIRRVVETAGATPVKVILECHYLIDDQIRRGAEICVRAGAAFVKTGTGWAPTGATLHNVTLIKSVIGDAAEIKAAGGVRDLETLLEMHRRGVTRFGIGLGAAAAIFRPCEERSR